MTHPPHRNARRGLIIILMIAAIPRIAVAVYGHVNPERFDQYPDSDRYLRVARNIANGNGPMESPHNRTGTDPLYPALLAIPMIVAPEADDTVIRHAARWINLPLGLIAVAAVYAIAWRLAGVFAALLAAGITALDPILVFFHGLVLTEVLYVTLLWSAVALLLHARDSGSLIRIAVAGALLGLSALARSSGLYLAPLVAFAALLTTSRDTPGTHLTSRITRTAFCLIAMAAIIAPTAWRNYRLLGHFTAVRTGVGASLMESWGPWADGGPGMQKIEYPDTPPTANEFERDAIFKNAAIDYAKANSAHVIELAWIKWSRTWSPFMHAPGYTNLKFAIVSSVGVVPVYFAAAAGLWLLRRRKAILLLLLMPTLYFSLVHMVFVGSVRYRVPCMPGLDVLAGVAAASIWNRRQTLSPEDATAA